MKWYSATVFAGISVLVACIPKRYAPPSLTPVERQPTAVPASFGKAWDAAIDVFTRQNFPIRTLDKPSGLLVSSVSVYAGANRDTASVYADCGTEYPNTAEWRKPLAPLNVYFNVVVRGDSLKSTVLVRGFFTSSIGPAYGIVECPSRGTFETMMERAISARAEGKS